MPWKPKPLRQKYWTIGEVAEMFDITTSEIRYWEEMLGEMASKRRYNNRRMYNAKDIQKVRTVYNLLNTEGFTLKGAKKRIEEIKQKIY